MGSKTQVSKNIKSNTIMDKVIFALISILIIGAPLFQGLFFEREILISNIVAFGIFVLFLFNKNHKKEKLTMFNSPYDYIGLLFIVAYLLPIVTFQWANLREAIDILIRYTVYYSIYLMIKDMVQIEKYKEYFAKVLILGSLIVAFIAVLGAAGYVTLDDVIMGNRLASTFQYPNTLAALMMAMFFLTTGAIHRSEKYIEKIVYGASGFVMLFTFIFTYSRAAWLLFPIFALLYLVFIPNKERISSILYFITALIPNVLVLQPFTSQLALDTETKPKALIVFIIGVGVFKLLYSGVIFVEAKLVNKHYKLIYGFLGAIVIGAGIFSYMAFNITQPLVFNNMNVAENHTNQIQRTVSGLESSTEYTLNLDVEAVSESENEGHWPYRVRIYSANEAGERELIEEVLGEVQSNGSVEIPFTTLEDSKNISIYFTNIYPKTKAVFIQANITNQNAEVLENIKLSYKYLPESLVSRFNSIDLSENNAATRLTYYKDSLSILKAKPIFGGGGGTWEALYQKYQSRPYNSTEAHNYFIQTMVETGIIGIAVLGPLIGAFTVHLLKAWKRKDTLTVSVMFSILALLGHSGLDFNFSFHSIPMIFWALIAMLEYSSFEDVKLNIKKIDFKGKSSSPVLVSLVGVPLLVFSISLYSANAIATSNTETINEIPIEESIDKMEKAVMLDPFHPNIRVDLAKMQMTQGIENGDVDLIKKAENNFNKAEKYTPNLPVVLQENASYYISLGEFEQAFKYLDKLVESAPLKQYPYATKVNAYNAVAEHYINGLGEIEQGVEIYRDYMLKIIDEVKEANEKSEETINLSQDTLQNIFRAKYFIDNVDNPEKLQELNDIVYMSYLDLEGATGVENTWRRWSRQGGKLEYEIGEEGMKVYNEGEDLGIVYTQNFTLDPGVNYEVEVVFSDNSTERNVRSHIISGSGQRTQVSQNINLDELENGTYKYGLTTTEDIEPGNQYLRFDHSGNSEGHFIIEKIIIKKVN